MTTLEECDVLVAEVWLASRVCCAPGERMTGAHLLRFRQLPAQERAYFAALVAPYEDPHAATRVQAVAGADDSGRCEVTYDPPYPESCGCARPVLAEFFRHEVRCCRCLHAWQYTRHGMGDRRQRLVALQEPLINSVDKADIGYAIERVLPPRNAVP